MDDLALAKWRALLGEDQVVTARSKLSAVERTTFANDRRILGILEPQSREQVIEVVKIANEENRQLYPISGGKNWGLGSRVPSADECYILNLTRLRAIEYDSSQGTLTVEPGVTFSQAAAYLNDINARHFLAVIGGPPEGSLIGNLCERGDGLGLLGDRANHACNFRVVLGTGAEFRTGFGARSNSNVAKLSKWGIGPNLDGLFTQSSLGVIVEATFWLQIHPESFQSLIFTTSRGDKFSETLLRVKELIEKGIVAPFSLGLWNSYKYAATTSRHPDPNGAPLSITDFLTDINPKTEGAEWFGVGALYSGTKKIGKAKKHAVTSSLKAHTNRLMIIGSDNIKLLRTARRLKSSLIDKETLESLYDRSVFCGYPTMKSVNSIYWRKEGDLPETPDADADLCGIHWMCNVLPFSCDDINAALSICRKIILEAQLEPNLALLPASERHVHLCVALIYDRCTPGADEKALVCHDLVYSALEEMGFSSYRLGIQSMDRYDGSKILHQMKSLFDPNNVISPGRYL